MLQRNEKWQTPETPKLPPEADLKAFVENYASSARYVDGVLTIWSVPTGPVLHIFTLIEKNRETERSLHGLEEKLLWEWAGPFVEFHITSERDALQEQLNGIQPAFTRT